METEDMSFELRLAAIITLLWIAFDGDTETARLTHVPDGTSAPFPLDLQRVVEYYATWI